MIKQEVRELHNHWKNFREKKKREETKKGVGEYKLIELNRKKKGNRYF